jgi:hypothetical protein
LTDGIALIVVPGARKSEEFGLKIRQPIGPFRQKTWPASNFAEATAIRLRLSPTGFTAMMPQISSLNS